MVTANDANDVLNEEKVISANLSWKQHGITYQLEAAVLIMRTRELLRLVGYVGIRNRSFALLYRNTPIRKYTVHARHRNPNSGQILQEPHKHTWDDVWEDSIAYIPDDIRAGNPNVELLDFLSECNITLDSVYVPQQFGIQGHMRV